MHNKNFVSAEFIHLFIHPVCDYLLPSIKETIKEEITIAFKKASEEEFLTRKQASNLLKVSIQTIDKWKKEGKLIEYKMEGSVRGLFNKGEIMNNLKALEKFQRTIYFPYRPAV